MDKPPIQNHRAESKNLFLFSVFDLDWNVLYYNHQLEKK